MSLRDPINRTRPARSASIFDVDLARSSGEGGSRNGMIGLSDATPARGTRDALFTPSMPAVFSLQAHKRHRAANNYMPDKSPSGAANPISDPSATAVPLSRASSATAAATAGATSRLNTDGMM